MERITICLTRHDLDYASVMNSLKDGLSNKGSVAPEIAEFVSAILDRMQVEPIQIPSTDADLEIDCLHIVLRPEMAIIGHTQPPSFE